MKKIVLLAALMSVLLGGGTAFGLWIADERADRNSLLSRIERKASAYLRSALATEGSTDSEVVTNRLTLEKRVFNMPLAVTDSGGGITDAPGGGVLVLDRLGKVFLHRDGQTTELPIATPDNGLDDLVRQHDAGEVGGGSFRARGFRFNDVLAIPGNAGTELLISYSDWEPDRLCYRNVIARVTLPGPADPTGWTVARDDWQELKAAEPCLPPLDAAGVAIQGIEAGGRLVALSGTEVAWSTGVYELDDRFKDTGIDPYAQREDSEYGRLLKINLETGETEVLARGLRNPQGLARASDGRLFVTDHGMRGGDELNVVEPGRPEYNFGWPYVSYGTHYNRRPVDPSGRHSGHQGYDLPLLSFVPSIAPGAALYVEDFHPVWDGDILVGGFRGAIERVHVVDGRVVFVEPVEMGVRIRDMAQTADGEIVIWTDNLQLIYLKPSNAPSPTERVFAAIDRIAPDARRQAVSDLMEGCLQCHGLAAGEVLAGPSLHGLCGARMGADTGFDQYSDALASSRRTWTEGLMAEFILDPQSVVPGTTMEWVGTDDRSAAGSVAQIICSTLD